MAKAKVGFFGITGCAGCLLSVIFNEEEILDIAGAVDIVAFPFIKGQNTDGPFDIVFIEGSVVSNDDIEMVKKLRANSKAVIALGCCACEGNIPAMRNNIDNSKLEYLQYEKNHQNQDLNEVQRVHDVIQVEYSIPGCPPSRDEVKYFIKQILLGKTFRNYEDPVCRECKLENNGCLIDEGEICLGPITKGGCKAICTTNGLKCYGCRGLTEDYNFDEYFKMMKAQDRTPKEVIKIMNTFMAIEIKNKLKGTKWEKLL